MKLSDLKVGDKARIISVRAIGMTRKRLMDMGVIVGEVLKVEKIAPLGDPIDILIRNYHLSLRKREAAEIEVEVIW
ncbi:MAG: FeoA family protein [Deltaproteobacteria bacterium]|nr:FeoA family protein [Deltaproteobacteria bacterium]